MPTGPETSARPRRRARPLAAACLVLASACAATADEPDSAPTTPAARGLHRLRHEAYSRADLTEEEFDSLWRVWPEELKHAAESASPAERRRLAFSRYGLVADPDRPHGPPLGMVDDGQGGWAMNCLACHQGKVAGRAVWGLGNSHFAFATFTADISSLRRAAGKRGGGMDGFVPLGNSNGTTNAQIFSVVLTAMRDKDLNVLRSPTFPRFRNHDLDAPPFWNVKHKRHLYIDGFVAKSHRVIMQFALSPSNSPESFKQREDSFRDILAWIESLEPPRYPFAVDAALAERGHAAFERVCADCHGTYGPRGHYPEKCVPIDELGTDSVRLTGMPAEHRRFYRDSWFGEYGKLEVVDEPAGYVAPPLHGAWASAPYFHNGSVPTLWHVLHPAERPAVWLRTEDGYDQQRVGLEVSQFDRRPESVSAPDERRRYFDTRLTGKSAAGHDFPDQLSADEKQAVLEYLKTL